MTRALMVVLELVPLACEALLRRVDAKEQRSLAQLPAATFDLQRGSGALGEGREHVTSVFLTPDRVRVPSGARPSEPRPQRFDGLLRFGEDELVVVIESKLFPHADDDHWIRVSEPRCRHLHWPRGRRLKWPHLASVVVGLDLA